jgi:hypothetical protein
MQVPVIRRGERGYDSSTWGSHIKRSIGVLPAVV